MSITWDKVEFEGPYKLESWISPYRAGVYAIMHKPDAFNKPNTFRIDYFGESADMSDRGFPWDHEKSDCWIAQAGSKTNVYIGIHLMPKSSKDDRLEVEQNLIDQHDLKCNKE